MKIALITVGTICIIYNLYWLFQCAELKKQAINDPENKEIQQTMKRGDILSRGSLAVVSIVYAVHIFMR